MSSALVAWCFWWRSKRQQEEDSGRRQEFIRKRWIVAVFGRIPLGFYKGDLFKINSGFLSLKKYIWWFRADFKNNHWQRADFDDWDDWNKQIGVVIRRWIKSGDSCMYPYQRTPMGNPYISPWVFMGSNPQESLENTEHNRYHGYTYVRGTPNCPLIKKKILWTNHEIAIRQPWQLKNPR